MRKKVSFLLSFVMFISMFSINPTYVMAAPTGLQFSQITTHNGSTRIGLKETEKEGLAEVEIAKDAEEAALQWSIAEGRIGNYELIYYSDTIAENFGSTTQVKLGFDVGKGRDKDGNLISDANKILVKAQLSKVNDSGDLEAIEFSGYQHEYPYEGSYSAVTTGAVYEAQVSIPNRGGTVANSLTELSLHIGANLKVAIKVEGDFIKVGTNQINKGYITDFELKYNDIKQGSVIVFPGLKNAQISSVYLQDELKDLERPIDASKGERAGSRPGIKVEIQKPLIRTGNKFGYISDAEANNLDVVLNLYTKLEADNTTAANKMQLNFKLKQDSPLNGETMRSTNKVTTSSNLGMIGVYIAKDDEYVTEPNRKYVVEWPVLEESMVIGGEIGLAGKITLDGTEQKIATGDVALPTGYTYLEFVPEQSNVGEVTLQITPYKYKGEITYKVYVANAINSSTPGTITPSSLLGEYKFIYDATYPDRKLEISIPSGIESIFLVKADLANDASDATSQEVYYNSEGPNVVVRPYTPYIREVNDIYVIPEGDTGVEAAGMNVIWSAPTEEKLKETLKSGRELYFELSLYNGDKANKAVIAIFKATLDSSNNVKVEQVGTHRQAEVTYDKDKNQFVAENVLLKDLDRDYWEKIILPVDYEQGTNYPTIDESSYATDMVYHIPNSFYLSMRAVLSLGPNSTTSLKTSANESQLYAMTLDRTTEVIPTPDKVTIQKAKDTTEVKLSFDDVKLDTFVKYVLTPAKRYLVDSDQNKTFPGTYEIALYQANYLADGNETKDNELSDSLLTSHIETNNENVYRWPATLTTTPAALNIADNQEALTALRKGKVVVFDLEKDHIGGGNQKIEFKGLDPNQSYYVRVRVKLDSQRTKNGVLEPVQTDYSMFSKIFAFTTAVVVKPIEPDEEVPPTPKNYTAKAKDNSTAVLNWQDPEIQKDGNTSLSYEIIRTTEQKLNEDLLKRNIKAEQIISQESGKKATLFGSSHYKLIDASTGDNTNGLEGAYYELIDDTLQPNTVYYYYIRTVYNGSYSDWIYQPVTTNNIDEPISLKAFNATKTTVDISFLAKVPSSSLYNMFDFGIAIQGEDGKWHTTLASSLSKITGETPTSIDQGYHYYAYRIPDLIPGKRYNIKVCVIDKTKDKIDGKYQQSLYSNIVSVRTTYDQDQQDKEDKFEEYLDRFDKEVEKFRNGAYWIVEDGTTYKYREDYLQAAMGLKKEYELVTEKNSNEANYYFPMSILSKMNDEKITFKIVLGDEEVYIRPNTIKNDNELLQEAADLVDANRLEDYYLNIKVEKNNYSGTINNEKVVSPKINVDMNIVYMKQEDLVTEADIIDALEEIIKAKREKFIDKLEAKLDNGKLDADILQGILDDVLADVEAQHMKKVSRIMDKQIKKDISVDKISNAILIIHNGEHAGVNGYYYLRNWTSVEVLTVGNGFAIEATGLGTYIFTGQKPLIDTVPQVAPYQNFINQYQLTEFFTMDNYSLSTAVSKKQVYGSLARMLGASKGSDYATYLESKGIKGVSKLTINSSIRQDEAIYIIMQGYEVMKHRKVETIVVKNRQGVQNIGAFQPMYRPYVYAAVELKIVQPQNSRVMPSKQMTGTEIIAMLYKLQG